MDPSTTVGFDALTPPLRRASAFRGGGACTPREHGLSTPPTAVPPPHPQIRLDYDTLQEMLRRRTPSPVLLRRPSSPTSPVRLPQASAQTAAAERGSNVASSPLRPAACGGRRPSPLRANQVVHVDANALTPALQDPHRPSADHHRREKDMHVERDPVVPAAPPNSVVMCDDLSFNPATTSSPPQVQGGSLLLPCPPNSTASLPLSAWKGPPTAFELSHEFLSIHDERMEFVPLVPLHAHATTESGDGDGDGCPSLRSPPFGLPGLTSPQSHEVMTTRGAACMLRRLQGGDPTAPPPRSSVAETLRLIDTLLTAFDTTTGSFRVASRDGHRGFLLRAAESAATGALDIMGRDPLVVRVTSPVMCFGDIHGSFGDAVLIARQALPFGQVKYQSCPVVFLGDYVDRGAHSLEVAVLLLLWKVAQPTRLVLLRGNHEDPAVNGDEAQYGSASFLANCTEKLGAVDGRRVWEAINRVFSRMPVAAIVDDSILACHGGIPHLHRPLFPQQQQQQYTTEEEACFQRLLQTAAAPQRHHQGPQAPQDHDDTSRRLMSLMPSEESEGTGEPTTPHHHSTLQQVIRGLVWNDPWLLKHEADDSDASNDGDDAADHHHVCGFRNNVGRGDTEGLIHEFTDAALDAFLRRYGFCMLLRAHQHKAMGLEVSVSATMITLFSSCNYAESNAAGGCWIDGSRVHLLSWRRPTLSSPSPPRSCSWSRSGVPQPLHPSLCQSQRSSRQQSPTATTNQNSAASSPQCGAGPGEMDGNGCTGSVTATWSCGLLPTSTRSAVASSLKSHRHAKPRREEDRVHPTQPTTEVGGALPAGAALLPPAIHIALWSPQQQQQAQQRLHTTPHQHKPSTSPPPPWLPSPVAAAAVGNRPTTPPTSPSPFTPLPVVIHGAHHQQQQQQGTPPSTPIAKPNGLVCG